MAKHNPALAVIGRTEAPLTPAAPLSVVPAADAAPAQATPKAVLRPAGATRVMIYLPPKVARKFKEMAFFESRKANDLYLEAVDAYLTKQGHGGIKGVTGR